MTTITIVFVGVFTLRAIKEKQKLSLDVTYKEKQKTQKKPQIKKPLIPYRVMRNCARIHRAQRKLKFNTTAKRHY